MKPRIAFVFGGNSVEHEISIITGLQAFHAFSSEKYDAFVLYLTKDNKMYVGKDLENIEEYKNVDVLLKKSKRVELIKKDNGAKLVTFPPSRFGKMEEFEINMAMMCVHGTNVEDGALQGFFKTYDIPIVGCDVESAALSMDKYVQKLVLKEAGIPVLDAKRYTYKDYENRDSLIDSILNNFDLPIIVKPVNLGSSVGISVANNRQDLEKSLDDAYQYSSIVLVEHAISNLREINCAILGDMEEAQASEIEEPFSAGEILSYEDKYLSGGKGKTAGSKGMASVSRQIPANVDSTTREMIQKYAIEAFKALGCSGVARVDFMIDCDDDNKIYFNEINTIPGSLSFYLFEPLGIKYCELLNKMIKIAEKRIRMENSLTYSFDTNVLDSASLLGTKGK